MYGVIVSHTSCFSNDSGRVVSLFDLAESEGNASKSGPSWATTSSPSPPPDGGGPSWASGRSSDSINVEEKVSLELMKRSGHDMLRGRRKSTEFLQVDEEFDTSVDENMGPDQIGTFVRNMDDQERTRSMNVVVSVLRQKIEDRDEKFLARCVLTVVRLATESSFASVRNAFSEILDLIRLADLPSVRVPDEDPVSTKWLRLEQMPTVRNMSDDGGLTSRLLRSIEVLEGRIPHVIIMLSWHPTFLERWYRTIAYLMRGPGPLPFTWRRFLSIVACARFQCMPLLKLQETDFLASGGDPSWISQGIAAPSLPPKLYALMELNGLLAHVPWRITPAKMEALLGLQSSKDGAWNVSELVHAMAIMVTFHSICGVVWGLGILPEVDISEAQFFAEQAAIAVPLPQAGDFVNDTSRIINMLKTGHARFSEQRQSWLESGGERKSTIWAQAEDGADTSRLIQQSGNAQHELNHQYCARYIGPFTMEYSDFDITSTEYSIFYKAQYNWANDGYAQVSQVLPELAKLFGSELQHIQQLTYNRFANEEVNIDTSAFREAIWHYAHRIKGLLDDDYNYSAVNQLLNRQMKYYIKKITCFPQTINMTDFLNLGYDLLPSEKCHIALLATDASKEASFSYALRALSSYLKK